MLKWLRNKFGACNDRWFHDWVEFGKADRYGIGGKRRCQECDLQQVCVGVHQPDVDLGAIRQWETVRAKS